jgi:hypothetical protein
MMLLLSYSYDIKYYYYQKVLIPNTSLRKQQRIVRASMYVMYITVLVLLYYYCTSIYSVPYLYVGTYLLRTRLILGVDLITAYRAVHRPEYCSSTRTSALALDTCSITHIAS